MNAVIRKQEYQDIADVERVYTLSWQQAYKNIINDEFLDELDNSEEDRIKKSQESYYQNEDKRYVLEVDNKIVGVLSLGKGRNEYHQGSGELKSLYIIDGYKGCGYGKKMFLMATKELIDLGYKDVVIGCLNQNPSKDF